MGVVEVMRPFAVDVARGGCYLAARTGGHAALRGLMPLVLC